jgi:hypothetical protein
MGANGHFACKNGQVQNPAMATPNGPAQVATQTVADLLVIIQMIFGMVMMAEPALGQKT